MIFNQVVFNGTRLNEMYGIMITGIKEDLLPPISTKRVVIPNRVGSLYVRKELGEREIEITFEILASSYEERREIIDRLVMVLYTEDEKELILRDKRMYEASLEGSTEIEKMREDGVGSLIFLATDPIAYGEDVVELVSGGADFVNKGSFESKGVFTLTMSENSSYLKITRVDNGEFVYLEDSFVLGDVVVIDFIKEKITKNGSIINNKLSLDSDYFSLPSGEFSLGVSNGTGELIYKARWI